MKKIYQEIASIAGAYHRCLSSNNEEWRTKHRERLEQLQDCLPSGSGIDCGTKIDLYNTDDDKITLNLSFHHMNENGMYDGWTDHQIIVTPSFTGFHLRITGKDKKEIKEYLYDVYSSALNEVAPEINLDQ